MSFFRQRIWINPIGNMPQMPSGVVRYSIGSYTISPPILMIDPAIPAESVGTGNVVVAQSASNTSLSLATEIPGISVTATSP